MSAVAIAAVSLTACGGSRGATPPTTPIGSQGGAKKASITMRLKVSKTTKQQAGVRKPKYVSPATNGVSITAYTTGTTPPAAPTIVVDVSGDAGSQCTANADGTKTCTIGFQAPVGLDTFAISAYDGIPANGQPTGNLLSANKVNNIEVMANTVNQVNITLNGQVASLAVTPSQILALADGQPQTIPISVDPLDADGYIILQTPFNNGNGQNVSVAITSGDPTHTLTLTPAGDGNPTDYVLQYTGGAVSDAVITATLPGVTAGTGNFTPMNAFPSSLNLDYKVPNSTAPLKAAIALYTGPVQATYSSGNQASACSVSPASQNPNSPGATVTFTVTGTNSGTCDVLLTATAAGQTVVYPVPVSVSGTGVGVGIGASKIKHVVFILEENRSFDNVFGGLDAAGKPFPGANTASHVTSGAPVPMDHLGNVVQLVSRPLGALPGGAPQCYNPGHEHVWQQTAIDGGKMDGFDLIPLPPVPCPSALPSPAPTDWNYQTLRYSDVKPYWSMAETYALSDNHFETISSGSFSEHLIAASGNNNRIIDNPTTRPWGCDNPNGATQTPEYIEAGGGIGLDYIPNGPFPCFSWPTFADVMTKYGKSWLYYAPGNQDFGYEWSILNAFNQDRYGPAWSNVISPNVQFINDVAAGKLAQFTWIVPTLATSDHPRSGTNEGPSYVTSLVNAVGASQFWSTTAVFIMWDDWGGMYDHVPPPKTSIGPGYGARTGFIAVSPYAKRGYVSHTFIDTASVLKFAEEILNIPSMGGYDTDSQTGDLTDMFDFTQAPTPFLGPFKTQYTKAQIMKLGAMPTGDPDDY
jgi:phospholipase C